jgi:lipopolysaccharide export LptBFGC system permease protein LptF
MNNHKKKMVAPILITIFVVLYYVLYFGFIVSFLDGILQLLLGIIPLALSVVMIYVCIQRVKEIKGGEEDDLGQY